MLRTLWIKLCVPFLPALIISSFDGKKDDNRALTALKSLTNECWRISFGYRLLCILHQLSASALPVPLPPCPLLKWETYHLISCATSTCPDTMAESALSTLPNELLIAIFDFLPEPCFTPYRYRSHRHPNPSLNQWAILGWLVVISVCKHWRAVALAQNSRPFLLPIYNKSKTAQLVKYYHPLPFSVHVSNTRIDVDAVLASMEFILDNAGDRIRKIKFSDNVCPLAQRLQPNLQLALNLNSWLARLDATRLHELVIRSVMRTRLCLGHADHPSCDIVLPTNMPYLEVLTLHNSVLLNPNVLEGSPLRCLDFDECPNALRSLPHGLFSRLEQLHLTGNIANSGQDKHGKPMGLNMPNLKRLTLASDVGSIASLLRDITFTVKTSLSLHATHNGPEVGSSPFVVPPELYSSSKTLGDYFAEITINTLRDSVAILCGSPTYQSPSSSGMTFSPSTNLFVSVRNVSHGAMSSLVTGLCGSILAQGKHRKVRVHVAFPFKDLQHSVVMPGVARLCGVERLTLNDNAGTDLCRHLSSVRGQKDAKRPPLFPGLARVQIENTLPRTTAAPNLAAEVHAELMRSELVDRDPKPEIVFVDLSARYFRGPPGQSQVVVAES